MSYNTRRQNFTGTPQQSAANVGQRRPVVTNNFVSGGQLSGTQQPKQQPQPQQARTPQPQQQSGINFRQQQPQQQNFTTSTPQQQQRAPQTPIKQEPPKVQPQVSTPAPKPATAAPTPVVPGANPPPPDLDQSEMDTTGEKKKFWLKNKGAKISRSERIRRRNLKLSKILQPKNAVMILNELVKGCVYTVDDLPVKIDGNQFRGTVSFDGQEFVGSGRTKSGAKNAAAETALKHIIKNKQVPAPKKEDGDGDEKMDTSEDEGSQVMPWSHIASFAMYKLFSMWGEDPNLVNRITPQEVQAQTNAAAPLNKSGEKGAPKPSKKLPENPEKMNPLQLMHQMLPNAVWEEIGKSGNPPNVVFTYGVTVEGKQFQGTGSNKKIAKRLGAFAACHELLGVLYPPDVWAPMY